MYKILWGFKIQTDHLISSRQPNRVNKKKETGAYRIVDIAVPADHKVNQEKVKSEISTQTLLNNLKKTMEHKDDGDTNCNWPATYSL